MAPATRARARGPGRADHGPGTRTTAGSHQDAGSHQGAGSRQQPGPGRADRWPRTRQPGTRATDRGPGSAALVFVNLGPGSQTRTDQQHKHKHGPGSSCCLLPGAWCLVPGAGRAGRAAALTWQQITARAAVIGQQITANQAARPTGQAATGSSCRARTRQQLRTIRAPGFTRRAARATRQAWSVATRTRLAGTNPRAYGRPVRYPAQKNPARGRVRFG